MWILESSSELFQGRRMWLKPGKSYLFGRVKKDGVRFAIDNKTISRKHFIIKVDDVNIEDVGNIHKRTRVILEDQHSKAGTHVNGELVKSSTKELKHEENYIKPGSLPEDLIVKWYPCVLTYNLLKKELKAGVLKIKQDRLRELDIKVVSEYVIGQTTHLVVNKRNTPKSLQALIDGKPLVAESYIDSLEYATTPSDLNEEENLSPLEQDFDSAWPIPYDHLPPPGREPTARPAEAYKPDVERKNVFENFTFVFLDPNQYDNLLPPITTGHGKALLYKMIVNQTTTEELTTFLNNAAGHKGFGDAHKEDDNGGVILVRYKGDAGAEEWTTKIVNEASLRLDQRAIDQGEFLDSILANDAMLLRQSVPYESNQDGLVAPPGTAVSLAPISQQSRTLTKALMSHSADNDGSPLSSAPQLAIRSQTSNGFNDDVSDQGSEHHRLSDNEEEPEPPTRKARSTLPKKSKVFDFDDDFDPDAIVPYDDEAQDSANQDLQPERPSTPSQDDEGGAVKTELTPSKKRLREPNGEASAGLNDDMDDLLPAAAAMKRRKLAKESQNGLQTEIAKSKAIPPLSKKPKKEKDINVREIARAQRKAEEDKAQKEQDDLDEELRIEPGQSLPVYDVETVVIDLPARTQPSNEESRAGSDRWDPNWNGRKNFKGFRRAGTGLNGENQNDIRRRNHNKVIVPLVDAKTSTYGIGDQYWDKTQEEKERERERKRKASQRATQSQSDQSRNPPQQQSQTVHGSDDENDHDEANGDEMQTSPELARLQGEAAEIMDHAVDVDEPRQTRASDNRNHTQTTSQSTRGAKRPANGVGRVGAAKKQKTLPVTVIHGNGSDSDDSDDLKFKFGSRRRGRGKA